MPANLENSAVATVLEKVSFHSNPKKKAMPKTVQTTTQLHSSLPQTSKVMLKILQGRLQQYINLNLQIFKLDLGRGNRNQIANLHWIIKNLREFQKKTSISALLTMPKPLTVWITINCGKLWNRWEYQTTWPASSETYMHVRKQQLKLDMEQQTGSK